MSQSVSEANSRAGKETSPENMRDLNDKLKIPVPLWHSEQFITPLKIKSSLVSARFCAAILGISEIEVFRMIEGGELQWAWDLRRKNARRSFIFVLVQCLRRHQERMEGNRMSNVKCPEDWKSVLQIILPHDKQLIKGSDIVRWFSISSQHMMNLVNDGLFDVVNIRRKKTSTPLLTRESVIEFLKRRLI